MKIALFTETYDNIDGVTTTIRQLEKYASRNGHSLTVITHAGQEGLYEGEARVYRLSTNITINLTPGYPIDLLPPIFRAEKIMEDEKPDIIHTVSLALQGFAASIAQKD